MTALTITSEYDGNENEIKRTTLDRNSGKTTLCEYEYDGNGNLIRTTQTADELTIVIQEAAYDNNGNQLEAKIYNNDGSIYDGSINAWHEYEHDSNGNETKYERKMYNNDGICFRHERYEKEYYNDGNIIKETDSGCWIEYIYE